jgi:large subunit ribosomal protein L3
MNTIFGRKTEQKQGFLTDGRRVPLTVIVADPLTVTDIKSVDKHGYSAMQVGLGARRKASKSLLGHVKKANLTQVPFLMQEVRMDAVSHAVGDVISVEEVLQAGDIIDVTGVSKGKGFAGGVKRYHFRGGPRTHGQSDRERAPGSIGQTTTPGRVYKGKKMAGNMGREQVTVQNLVVLDVNPTTRTVLVRGLVPGILKSVIEIKKTGQLPDKKFVGLDKIVEEKIEEEVVVEATAPVEEAVQPEAVTPETQEEVVTSDEQAQKEEEKA